MLVIACVLLGVLAVPLTGGRLSALAGVHLRDRWTLAVAVTAQVVALELVSHAGGVARLVHLLTYVLAGVFVVRNRRVPGLVLLGFGAALNALTISLNSGTLPADPGALARAGVEPEPGAFVNSGVVDDAYLWFLGDVFAWPEPMPLANVFSVGDVLIVVGAVWGVHRICRRRRPDRSDGTGTRVRDTVGREHRAT